MTKIIVEALGDAFYMEVVTGRDGPPVFHIHHHYKNRHGPTRTEEALLRGQETMFGFLEALRAKVAPLTDQVKANETLLKDLSTRLRQAIEDEDPEQAKAILDSLDANTNNLARAAAENVVPAPVPPSEPIADDPLTEWDESKGETGPQGGGQAETQ